MQDYPEAKRHGTADMAKRREHKRQRKMPKTDDDVDLNGPMEPSADDTYVKVMFAKVVNDMTIDRKQLKSLLGARHVDVFKAFCILHYTSAKAAESACDRIMAAKHKPTTKKKTPAKQSTLKFGGGK